MVPLYWLTIASQLAVLDAHSVLYVLAAVPVLYMCYVFSNCWGSDPWAITNPPLPLACCGVEVLWLTRYQPHSVKSYFQWEALKLVNDWGVGSCMRLCMRARVLPLTTWHMAWLFGSAPVVVLLACFPSQVPPCRAASTMLDRPIYPGCIFSIVDKIADKLGAHSAAAWHQQITHYVWFNQGTGMDMVSEAHAAIYLDMFSGVWCLYG